MNEYGPFIVAGLALGSLYALSGVGIVVLYRATGTLNLAHGALGAVAAMLAWELRVQQGWPLAVALLAGLIAAVLIAWVFASAVMPRLAQQPEMTRAAGTLGLLLVLLGAMNWYWADVPRRLELPTDTWGIDVLDVRVTGTRLLAVGVTLAITAGVGVMLVRTLLGLTMRSMADDRAVAARLGIDVRRTMITAWLIAGAIAGVSGILLGNLSRLDGPSLTFLVIPGLAAAVAGRLTSLPLTLAAGFAMGLIESVSSRIDLVSDYRSTTPYVIGLLVVFWTAATSARAYR